MFEEHRALSETGTAGGVPAERVPQGRPHATASKTFNLYQAAVDASKFVASRRARRNAKSRMVGVRSHFLVKRRPLPAFLIIGTMRGGTSSLFKYLASHPDTAASLRKEVNFFTRFWTKGRTGTAPISRSPVDGWPSRLHPTTFSTPWPRSGQPKPFQMPN